MITVSPNKNTQYNHLDLMMAKAEHKRLLKSVRSLKMTNIQQEKLNLDVTHDTKAVPRTLHGKTHEESMAILNQCKDFILTVETVTADKLKGKSVQEAVTILRDCNDFLSDMEAVFQDYNKDDSKQ